MPKGHLTDTQFLLIVNGPSCSGKSTVANVLLDRYGGIFHAKSDAIKWLISGYDPEEHRTIVHEMTLTVARIALADGLSALKEGGLHRSRDLIGFCVERGIATFVANMEPPEEVLWRRFEERIKAKEGGARISNTDPERFRQLNRMYHESKMETPLVFDTSQATPEDIADAIVEHIRSQRDSVPGPS